MPGMPLSPNKQSESEDETEHDPHFKPVVTLPLVDVPTHEENEIEMCKIRARLYRFDKDTHEWKERGTGDIKLMHHANNGTVRIVMRRDKTLKICANHFITPELELREHIKSDRAFNWTVMDYADEVLKQEFLAVKFGNVQNAKLWKDKFTAAIDIVKGDTKPESEETNKEAENKEESKSQCTESEKTENKEELISQLSELKLEKETAVTAD